MKKISSLIALLSHQRDVLLQLMEERPNSEQTKGKLMESLIWLSQLHYTYNNEDKSLTVKVCIIFMYHFIISMIEGLVVFWSLCCLCAAVNFTKSKGF